VDAASLPKDKGALAEFMEQHTVFGRVRPEDKRDMVEALQSRGHVVAMTGDGVNDVLALKTADLGIAMGAGAPAARAVADLVLMDGKFSSLPGVVNEGRRVIANVERVANLFVTKSVYAALLAAVTIAFALKEYPLMPRHFTFIDALTIGIPGFFLALAPAAPRYRPGFLKRVMRFTFICGAVVAAAASAAYYWGLNHPEFASQGGFEAARTVTVWTILFLGLWVLVELSRPLTRGRAALVAGMAAAAGVVWAVPFAREFFQLPQSPTGATVAVVCIVGVAIVVIEIGLRLAGWRPGTQEAEED
jgi:cation-transporting ATPase E